MWGKRDAAALTGTVATTNGSDVVTGTGTLFTSELTLKDVIEVGGNNYRVVDIVSDTQVTIHMNAVATVTGVAASVRDIPKYVSEADLDKVVFVDMTEANVQTNRDRGLRPGWNLVQTYVDSGGNTRWKVEPLIPMKVDAVTSGDSTDDTIVPDA